MTILGFPPGGEIIDFEGVARGKVDAILVRMLDIARLATEQSADVGTLNARLVELQVERAKLARLLEVFSDAREDPQQLWMLVPETGTIVLSHASFRSNNVVLLEVERRGLQIRATNFWFNFEVA